MDHIRHFLRPLFVLGWLLLVGLRLYGQWSTISSFSPTTGSCGTTVWIYGTNLGLTSSVKFGGTDATSFTVVSPTAVRATVGTGSSGDVTVTAFGTATLAGFVWDDLTNPTITCPGNATVSATPGLCTAVLGDYSASAT